MIAVVFISFVCSSGLLSLSNYSSVCSVIRTKQKTFWRGFNWDPFPLFIFKCNNLYCMPRREKQPRIAFLAFTKNCAMSRILPYLWVNKLAYHSFMDVDGRYETPGSKRKNFVTHGESSSWRVSLMFICAGSLGPASSKGEVQRDLRGCLHMQWTLL